MSEEIRNQDLYAFVEIPVDLLEVDLIELARDAGSLPVVEFYSEDSNFSDARRFMSLNISELVKAHTLRSTRDLMARSSPVAIRWGKIERRRKSFENSVCRRTCLLLRRCQRPKLSLKKAELRSGRRSSAQ